MSNTSVDLTFTTLRSTLPQAQQAFTPEEVRRLFETAVVEGGVGPDGQLVTVMSDQPGQSFSMRVAPQLAQPSLDGEALTVDTALALLAHLQTTLFQMNLVSNAMRVQIDSLTQQIQMEEQRDDTLDAMDAQIAARNSANAAGVTDGLAMGGAILGAAIALALAALFTGGLALGVAGVAVVMAVMEVGSAIAKAAGAKAPEGFNGDKNKPLDFTVAGLTQMAIDAQVRNGLIVIAEQRPDGSWVDAQGKSICPPTVPPERIMSPTAFNNYYAYTGMAFSLALGVGMMVGGFAAARMAVDVAKFAANVAKLNQLLGTAMSTKYVQHLGNTVEAATTLVEGVSNISNGAVQVDLAVKKAVLEKLQAALEHLQAQIDFITQHMNLIQKIISEQAEKHNESMVSTIRSIGQYYHGQTQIAHNLIQMG